MTRNELNIELMENVQETRQDFRQAAHDLSLYFDMPNLSEGWSTIDFGDFSVEDTKIPLEGMTADQADYVVGMISDMLSDFERVRRMAEYWADAVRAYENRMEYECDDD